MDAECSALLKQYEESGDPDIADHLIESLDAARRQRWEESTAKMDYTRSSRKSWSLIRRLGAAQRPPKMNHPPVKANAVAAHLVKVAKARATRSLNDEFEISGAASVSRPQTRAFLQTSHQLNWITPCGPLKPEQLLDMTIFIQNSWFT
jgi:hypothetical protein